MDPKRRHDTLTNADPGNVDTKLMLSEKMLKRSYHVLVRGIVFDGGNADANFMEFINAVPALYTLNKDSTWTPRVRFGGPNQAVYTKNRPPRILGCSKLGIHGPYADPAAVTRFDDELTAYTHTHAHTKRCADAQVRQGHIYKWRGKLALRPTAGARVDRACATLIERPAGVTSRRDPPCKHKGPIHTLFAALTSALCSSSSRTTAS
jgi:hypothetical protein